MGNDTERHVEDVMTASVATISRDATVSEAASTMRDRNISSLLVLGGETGIVTSTDVLEAVAEARDPERTHVEDLMTASVESINVGLRLQEVAAMMTNYGINHLPVRDKDGDYVGIVSSTDLRETIASQSAEQ
ncbi:histidine kinase [Halobacteriales archaeon QH_10_70_21]|jgi:CBS domain-containing protein|nr:MAG: histidine kinase [Halobacteriales archaeon QH_10_70_21]